MVTVWVAEAVQPDGKVVPAARVTVMVSAPSSTPSWLMVRVMSSAAVAPVAKVKVAGEMVKSVFSVAVPETDTFTIA